MQEDKTKNIGSALQAKNLGQSCDQVLEFDPTTGELVARQPGEIRNPDATTVDQIATDGFAI